MTSMINDHDVRIVQGDALERLREMPDESVQCIVTSPPFWGLRDYGCEGQIGLEDTPDEWCARLVAVFREARRVLRSDGVMWLECGDTYNATPAGNTIPRAEGGNGAGRFRISSGPAQTAHIENGRNRAPRNLAGLKPKDLVGAPWMLAFALRADGWYLRSDTIWARPNPMPESVTDRPTKAHSYVFLMTKSARYFYDSDAIREASLFAGVTATSRKDGHDESTVRGGVRFTGEVPAARNARSVWSISTEPTSFAHFATFPQALVEKCVKAGSREGDTILDPFMGSGTTALVARRLGRHAVGIELNSEYIAIAAKRLQQLTLLEAHR